jgi:hypothetical protein
MRMLFLPMEENDILDGWTIYDHPRDYPADFVARRWIANRDGTVTATNDILRHTDLDTVRGMLGRVSPKHSYRMPRMPDDDPNILEVWL